MRTIFSFPKGGRRTMRYVRGVFSNFDGRIFLLFAILAIIGGTIFFIKYQNYVDCGTVKFFTDAPDYESGTLITFENNTPNAKIWMWDFGDNTPVRYLRREWTLHKYAKPGRYMVTLTINGDEHCAQTQVVEIEGDLIADSKMPNIIAPKMVSVGEPVQFDCKYPGEIFFLEWRFGESVRPDATIKNPEYIFYTSGIKKISLVVNGEVEHKATETIYVSPRETTLPDNKITMYVPEDPEIFENPPGEPEEDPGKNLLESIPGAPTTKGTNDEALVMAPDISKEQFERLLIGVANKTKVKEDFADYTCNEYDDVEVIKNEEQLINFAELCQLVRGKRIKIKSLRLVKNDRNCIARLEIDYRVRKVLGLLWVKD